MSIVTHTRISETKICQKRLNVNEVAFRYFNIAYKRPQIHVLSQKNISMGGG